MVPKVTNRTDDLSLTRGLLYRLSYKGEGEDWLLVYLWDLNPYPRLRGALSYH